MKIQVKASQQGLAIITLLKLMTKNRDYAGKSSFVASGQQT